MLNRYYSWEISKEKAFLSFLVDIVTAHLVWRVACNDFLKLQRNLNRHNRVVEILVRFLLQFLKFFDNEHGKYLEINDVLFDNLTRQ